MEGTIGRCRHACLLGGGQRVTELEGDLGRYPNDAVSNSKNVSGYRRIHTSFGDQVCSRQIFHRKRTVLRLGDRVGRDLKVRYSWALAYLVELIVWPSAPHSDQRFFWIPM
jgi:hypothetical protein